MKQIKVFKNPEEVALANAFLAITPPEQVSSFDDKIVINYDDQSYPDAYKAEEVRGLMLSNTKQTMTSQISLETATMDLEKYVALLSALEKTEVPMIVVESGKSKWKEIPDPKLVKDREKKIEEYKRIIGSIEEANRGLVEAIERFETRNTVMEKFLTTLNLKSNG